MVSICVLGSSTSWTPGLVTDLVCTFDEPLEIRLMDINPAASKLCAEWGAAANRHHGRKDKYVCFGDRREALKGADAVIITLSTGGLDAMENDLLIPEKYGIYGTVGDTPGPSGWSRAIRNIPVFMEFARDFQEICPTAFIANYTNPLSALSGALGMCCDNPVVWLCHAYFEMKDVIQKIHGLEDWSKLSVSIAGMNHFTWVVDYTVDKQDGYKLLREKLGDRSLRDVMPKESADEIGIWSGHEFCVELFDAFGYLPYPADRHTCEFVSSVLCGWEGRPERYESCDKKGEAADTVRYCNIRRTSIDSRRKSMPEREEKMRQYISGEAEMPKKTRETSAEMIAAYVYNKPFVDAVNVLNAGQVPGLPIGACVETLGCIDGLGARPLFVKEVPEHLLEVMRPHAICQKWTTEGVIERDRDKVLQGLYRDPQCAHLKFHEIRQMAEELFEANKKWVSF